MTEEEVRAHMITHILNSFTLSNVVRKENIGMAYAVTLTTFYVSSVVVSQHEYDYSDNYKNFRYGVVVVPSEIYDYMKLRETIIISFEDLLDYKTLMEL